MPGSVILSGARTPFGKLSGALAGVSATDLGGVAIRGALERAGIRGEDVDYVFMGQVIQAGSGQMPARQAAFKGGIPMTVPSTGINKACPSGMHAIYLADLMIQAGHADVVVAGGTESMTNTPFFIPGARAGLGVGDKTIVDSLMHDGLHCGFDHCAMGESTERDAAAEGLERAPQDDLAAKSHQRAAAAIKSGAFAEEIVGVEIPQRRGEPLLVDTDEGVRPETTPESLAGLRPAFSSDGNITAGNASQISDGAAVTIVVSAAKAAELGVEPLGEVVGYGQVAGPDTSLLHQPSQAIAQALARAGMNQDQLELYEINEAFAAVAVTSMADLGITDDVVNVNGGAIALGHPVGASGARITFTLLMEMKRRGLTYGAAALCGGGGQGDAIIVRAL